MMTIKEALNKFNKKHPELKVESAYQLKSNGKRYFLICAPEFEDDYNDPFYAVDQVTGQVSNYIPTADFDNFNIAMEHEVSTNV